MFKKLPRFLQQLLRMLGMAPKPPKFGRLFTVYGQHAFLTSSIELWNRKCIHDNPFTLDCLIIKISWYKKQNGIEHESLQFDILSPDRVHTSIIIAERGGGSCRCYTTHRYHCPVTPLDAIMPSFSSQDVMGDSTISSANKSTLHVNEVTKTNGRTNEKARHWAHVSSTSSSFQRGVHDLVSYATLDSSASAELECKCKKAAQICMLTFPEGVGPSANELATLLYVTSKHEPTYTITNTQCYWFVDTVFEALMSLFPGAQQDIVNHQGGMWNRVWIHTKESIDEVCGKYCAARTALAKEAEQKHRAEQQQEEERQWECEQCQVAEEVMKRECEKCQAAEEWAWEMVEERERECQVAVEEITQLWQELEALRVAVTARQV
ncbi:hypothetical protein EDC04DRAFT_2608173 [Pisolithus marmoratus]|nr:hypothetical protein EDC04DRAFT_2608173 [Pisolithus marmoratus]